MLEKKYIYPIAFSAVLAAFTVYAMLDTFLLPRTYAQVESDNSFVFQDSASTSSSDTDSESDVSSNSETNDSSASEADESTDTTSDSVVVSEDSYSDENIQIEITEYREYDTAIYVADITISSLQYLKTAFAQNSYGKNVTAKTSEIAENVDAILAINGDYYGAQESGYVIRNGVLYRSESAGDQEDLVIWADGSFEVINESDVTAEELLENGAYQVLSFGPGLVEDGVVTVSEDEEVGKAKASNPRTAIGIIDTNHIVFVVSDGRTSESDGLSIYELATFMQGLGVTTAYNLDGGGSSTIYFNGEVINNPTTNGKKITERSVSDIVYIGY